MNVNLSIKEVPDALAQRLRARAERHHRSLQGELMAIIEQAVAEDATPDTAAQIAAAPVAAHTALPQGWKTVEQLMAERRASGWQPHPSLAALPLAVDIIRADRDSR